MLQYTNLGLLLSLKYPNLDPLQDYIIQDDGQGSYLKEWNVELPIPTIEELDQEKDQLILNNEINKLRKERNQLLRDTDYILMPDYPKQDKSAFIQYRQALRDITNNINSLEDIDNLVWPEKPTL